MAKEQLIYIDGYHSRNEIGENKILAIGYSNKARTQKVVCDTPQVVQSNEVETSDNMPSIEVKNGSSILHPRELQVAYLVSLGLVNKVIATKLGISHQTVKNHMTNICKKLGFTNRTEVAIWYKENCEEKYEQH